MRQKQVAAQPQLYWNTRILLTICLIYKCSCANIKVGVAVKLLRENLALNAQQTNEGLYL